MNYAHLADWIRERVEDLVAFGVPRGEAEALMKVTELGAVRAYTDAKNEAQFLLDFDALGSEVLAHRRQCSPQAIRKLRTRILARKKPEVARTVAG